MAQLAFGVAGAGLGSLAGPLGSQVGYAAGSMLGGMLFPPDDIIHEGPRLTQQPNTTSAFGLMRPIIYGTLPINGNVLQVSELYETKRKSKQDAGGKGGAFGGGQQVVTVSYSYSIDLAIGLGVGPIADVLKIYANEKLIYDITPGSTVTSPEWLVIRVHKGTEDQMPDPTLEVLTGEDTSAYRGEAYVVFTRFQLEEFGNQIPAFRFLVVSDADPVVSTDQKDFNTAGDIGALLQDRNTSLLYYLNSGRKDDNLMGYVYDPATEDVAYALRWPDGVSRFDEGGGAVLFSVPKIIGGIVVPQGPNTHLAVSVEVGDDPYYAVFEALSGAYLGYLAASIGDWVNTLVVASDERDGVLWRKHSNFFSQYDYLESWRISSQTLGLQIASRGRVQIPVPNRDGILEWEWYLDPSYPEGTTRNGQILVFGVDRVDDVNYLCQVDDSTPQQVERTVVAAEFALGDITVVVWDSQQAYWWVIGQDAIATGKTRIIAYDSHLSLQHSELWDNQLYTNAEGLVTYDPATFSLWLFDFFNGELHQWSTVNRAFENLYSGLPGGSPGSPPGLVYSNFTRTAWRRKGNGLLDLYRLGRITDSGIGLDAVVADLCDKAGLQPGQYDVGDLAAVTVEGYGIATDGTIRSKLVPLQQAYLFDGIDKGDQIDFKFRGPDLEATIPVEDLGAVSGGDGQAHIEIARAMDLELPGKTEVTYYSRPAEYEQQTQMARRWASKVKENSVRITLPLVLTDDEGIQLADVQEHLFHIEREGYTVNVLPKWQYLSTGDVVEIETPLRTYRARIVRKAFEDGLVALEAVRENTAILQSFLAGGEAPGRDVTIITNPLMQSVHLDIPLLRERDDNAGYYLAACGMTSSWTGGKIYKSTDGSTFSDLLTVLQPSTLGTMRDALPGGGSATLWDRGTVATVAMRCGVLESVSELEALRGANTIAVGAHGRWEVISFATATALGGGLYEIRNLLRGRLGTEWAIGMHQLGDIVCTLSLDDLSYVQNSLSDVGTQYLYRAVSLGENLYGDRTIDQFHTNNAVCLKPYAPAGFEAIRKPNLDILFRWRERSRYLWRDYWSGVSSNEGEYEIDIALADDSVKTVSVSAATEYLYTRIEQEADGFDDQLIIRDCSAYQLSSVVGRGYPATTQVAVGPIPDPMTVYAKTIGLISYWECSDLIGSASLADSFNNYPLTLNNTYSLEQSPLLPGSSTNSVEFSGTGYAVTAVLPNDGSFLNILDYSILVIFQPQVTSTREDQAINTVYLDRGPSETDMSVILRKLNGTMEARHINGYGEEDIISSSRVIGNGETVQLIITFSAPAAAVRGPFKFFINGALEGSFQSRVSLADDTAAFIRMISAYSPETTQQQTDQHRQSHLMLFDHALTDTEVANLFNESGL